MKRILNKVIVNPFNGEPVPSTYVPDEKRKCATCGLLGSTAIANAKCVECKDDRGRRLSFERSLTTAGAVRQFLSLAFARAKPEDPIPSIEDSSHAIAVLNALLPFRLLAEVEGTPPECIVLDEDHATWLEKQFDEKATKVFGILGAAYRDALKDVKKREEPVAKKLESVEA